MGGTKKLPRYVSDTSPDIIKMEPYSQTLIHKASDTQEILREAVCSESVIDCRMMALTEQYKNMLKPYTDPALEIENITGIDRRVIDLYTDENDRRYIGFRNELILEYDESVNCFYYKFYRGALLNHHECNFETDSLLLETIALYSNEKHDDEISDLGPRLRRLADKINNISLILAKNN